MSSQLRPSYSPTRLKTRSEVGNEDEKTVPVQCRSLSKARRGFNQALKAEGFIQE